MHSFPEDPLPYERDPHAPRPGVCIGTDNTHTPRWLRDLAAQAFADVAGGVAENAPFAGTYVPLPHYERHDKRVSSIMIELRRDTYLDGPTTLNASRADILAQRLARLFDGARNLDPTP